jgi:hypothetical protein
MAARSLATLRLNFFVHSRAFADGLERPAEHRCLCQKHPWTKITLRRRRKRQCARCDTRPSTRQDAPHLQAATPHGCATKTCMDRACDPRSEAAGRQLVVAFRRAQRQHDRLVRRAGQGRAGADRQEPRRRDCTAESHRRSCASAEARSSHLGLAGPARDFVVGRRSRPIAWNGPSCASVRLSRSLEQPQSRFCTRSFVARVPPPTHLWECLPPPFQRAHWCPGWSVGSETHVRGAPGSRRSATGPGVRSRRRSDRPPRR